MTFCLSSSKVGSSEVNLHTTMTAATKRLKMEQTMAYVMSFLYRSISKKAFSFSFLRRSSSESRLLAEEEDLFSVVLDSILATSTADAEVLTMTSSSSSPPAPLLLLTMAA